MYTLTKEGWVHRGRALGVKVAGRRKWGKPRIGGDDYYGCCEGEYHYGGGFGDGGGCGRQALGKRKRMIHCGYS